MKLCITYVVICFVGLQSIGFNAINLANFTSLISHYNHHKLAHQDSFFEFIDLHYGSQKQAHSDEHEEHQNLPFQEGNISLSTLYFTAIVSINLNAIQLYTPQQKSFTYQSSFSYLHAKKILQPPKHLIDVIS
jgi:hypothetical protein